MGLKPTTDELAVAMQQALAAQQNEELALVKAQLAVATDKNGQLERQIVRLKAQLKEADTAMKFAEAFQAIILPLIPEPVYVPVVDREVEAAQL